MTASITSSPLNALLAASNAATRRNSGANLALQLQAEGNAARRARGNQSPQAVAQNARAQNLANANPNRIAQRQAIAAESQNVQLQARSLAVRASPGATLTTQYDYELGPDGQLFVSSVTITSTERIPRNAVNNGINNGVGDPRAIGGGNANQNRDLTPFEQASEALRNLANVRNPRANLQPSEEAELFTSERFAEEARSSVDIINRGRLQTADFATRTHETLHFRTGGGNASAPEFVYQTGPDGEQFAIGGSVAISSGSSATPEEAARDAQNVANAALAANDVSAQDISVARDALANGASNSAASRRFAQQATAQYQQQSDLIFTINPIFNSDA